MPAWIPDVDRRLARVLPRVRLLASVTPANVAEERAKAISSLGAGRVRAPSWTYHPMPEALADACLTELASVDRMLSVERGPWVDLYGRRVAELAVEIGLARSPGLSRFRALAEKRFSTPVELSRRAAAIEREWTGLATREQTEVRARMTTTDGSERQSLVSRTRALVGALKLPWRVEVHPNLSSRAAVGEGVIYVARGRELSVHAARRTAVHEVFGHAAPRTVAASLVPGIFRLGTARGADAQEGYAVEMEREAGLLDTTRRIELARRRRVVRRMRDGASWEDGARALLSEGVAPPAIVSVLERAYRGARSGRFGLGRELIYVDGVAAIEHARKASAAADDVLGCGLVGGHAVQALAPWVDTSASMRARPRDHTALILS